MWLKLSVFLVGIFLAGTAAPGGAKAQEAVVGARNPDALFTSPDPVLNRNKQAAYHIVKDLLEADHWDEADRWMTAEYHQHNPLVPSGRDHVVDFFSKVLKRAPKPVPQTMATPVVAVLAEGDLVTVVFPRTLKDPKDPSKTYTTTWFDMWRFKDGKADEHWDPASKDLPPGP
ncbi:nuclear transport factor 2 family protein [Nitrospirillum iridis]|uniref:Putative SnoaL-like aldol condensation-catalyzing enzyme n=1 Tax=Nitrospirillum iridis TaxID=765888 RepID=A0A7X0AZF3_9PROT|nr:nuclear transport factor 2 family protein [Nitrospirillum iridis]MBB6252967.1 putative SnoaL-like aldol condensation-catalyzing enzyme [Nitrospirillum iridis]